MEATKFYVVASYTTYDGVMGYYPKYFRIYSTTPSRADLTEWRDILMKRISKTLPKKIITNVTICFFSPVKELNPQDEE